MMAIIDVVKYEGGDQEFLWKFPSENLRFGTQLVVKTAQTAFFVRGGQVLDQFGPGTTTLKSANIPLLHKLVSIPFGGDTPFQADVWFINLISKLDNRWGTPAPIQLEDPRYGIVVPVKAFGQFGLSIADPRLFLETIVGTIKLFSAEKLVEYFTGKIVTSFTNALGALVIREKISILDLPAQFNEVSQACQDDIQSELAKFGVEVPNFYVMSINVPENDSSVRKLKEFKEKKMSIDGLGKDIYQFDRSMDVMNTAAENQGNGSGPMGAGLGLGMGLGAGAVAGQVFGNIAGNLTPGVEGQAGATPPPPPPSSAPLLFHVHVGDQQYGPYSVQTIASYINEGRITADALVWRQGMANWASIRDLREFDSIGGSSQGEAPPPPPAAPPPPPIKGGGEE